MSILADADKIAKATADQFFHSSSKSAAQSITRFEPTRDCNKGEDCDEVAASAWCDELARIHLNTCEDYCIPWLKKHTASGILRT